MKPLKKNVAQSMTVTAATALRHAKGAVTLGVEGPAKVLIQRRLADAERSLKIAINLLKEIE